MKLDRTLILSCFFLIVLSASFYDNIFKTVDYEWFQSFQLDSESLVAGKLALSQNDGIFAKGGLTGRYNKVPNDKDRNLYQYDLYCQNINLETRSYTAYLSQTGGQAIMLSYLSWLSPFSNTVNLNLFHLINAFLTSLALSILLFWIARSHGLIVAVITFIFIFFSPWFTVFGRNMWWALWSFFIPMILVGSEFRSNNNNNSLFRLLAIAFLGLFIKCFFTGFEYISTTCMMMFTPLVYYSSLERFKFKKFIKKTGALVAGALTAIVISVTILSYQVGQLKGSFQDGLEHIYYSYKKRSSGSSDRLYEMYNEKLASAYNRSLDSDLSEVLITYLKKDALDFILFNVSFLWLIFLFLFSTTLIVLPVRVNKVIKNNQNKALAITLWFSILAPLSWFILFKGHSYIHHGMNSIVWYMPFCIVGFVLVSNVLYSTVFNIYSSMKSKIKI